MVTVQVSSQNPAPGQLNAMPDAECTKRLRSNDIGRIALVDREVRPIIFPVNYFFEEGIVAFRTAPGTKLDLAPGAPVCFEIDGWEADSGTGWSVVVKGIAHDMTNPRGAPTGSVRFWPVRPLAPGSREHWIGVWANEITGRWFRTAAHRPTS
ncbi:MAG: pyridoxamine 5'-phosphate oxidase family protein [Chloroflexi bacterium]|nr:MAG: pyridoxamine 5'-phosphate oxidase family protein [Chloroflexota bacterium]